jgi:hypothetical protein
VLQGEHVDADLAALATKLGVSVRFQPDTLTPDEIGQGIKNLDAASQAIRDCTRTKLPILIGRRTESDPARVRSAGELLIAFGANADEVNAALALLQNDNSAAVAAAISAATALYAGYGVSFAPTASSFGAGSDMTNDSALTVVEDILARFESVATPQRLAASRITSVAFGTYDSGIRSNSDGSAVLSLDLSRLDEVTLGAWLTTWESTFATAARLAQQESYLRDLGSQATEAQLSQVLSAAMVPVPVASPSPAPGPAR